MKIFGDKNGGWSFETIEASGFSSRWELEELDCNDSIYLYYLRLLFGFPGSTHLPPIWPINLAAVSAFCETTGSICRRISAVVSRPLAVVPLPAWDPEVWSLCDVEVSGLADARDAVNRLKVCHRILNKIAFGSCNFLPWCGGFRSPFFQHENWAVGCSTRHNNRIARLVCKMYVRGWYS